MVVMAPQPRLMKTTMTELSIQYCIFYVSMLFVSVSLCVCVCVTDVCLV